MKLLRYYTHEYFPNGPFLCGGGVKGWCVNSEREREGIQGGAASVNTGRAWGVCVRVRALDGLRKASALLRQHARGLAQRAVTHRRHQLLKDIVTLVDGVLEAREVPASQEHS